MVGNAKVVGIEEVKYTKQNGDLVEGFQVHCIQIPEVDEEKQCLLDSVDSSAGFVEIMLSGSKVSRCWVSKNRVAEKVMQGLCIGCNVKIRAGKFGEYIEYVL